jgi:hypothetical protein
MKSGHFGKQGKRILHKVYHRGYCDMTTECQNNGARRNFLLLGNSLINKFLQQQTCDTTTEELLEVAFSM